MPLDSQGIKDAEYLAEYFCGQCLHYIFTSPKKRALNTAQIIAGRQDCKPVTLEFLSPWNIGEFGGKPKDQTTIQQLQQYIEHPNLTPKGGESLNSFRERIAGVVDQTIDLAVAHALPVMLVAHSSVVHEIGALILNDHMATKVKPGGVAEVYADNGKLCAKPVLYPDKTSTTQNVLGTIDSRINTIS